MPKNLEIKARVGSWMRCIEKVSELASSRPSIIKQEDVFFNVPTGRLKLRIFSRNRGQLIRYVRSDESGPKVSEYHIVETDCPGDLLNVLKESFGTRAVVRKIRHVFIIGRTRVHLDEVDDLGRFIELEVVMKQNESVELAQDEADTLMRQLDIKNEELLTGSYADLIFSQSMASSPANFHVDQKVSE